MKKVTIAKIVFEGRDARVFLSSGDELVMLTDASVSACTDSLTEYHIVGYIRNEGGHDQQPH